MEKRILFVDDEPGVLDGLRNVLRGRRKQWDMVFACGGPAGLEEIERAPFDVVVSDMRMPRIDGATLLTRVRELRPETVRIVLSGQSDRETALRSVFVAHQFLAKPCEAQAVAETIARACALKELLSEDALRAAAGDISSLPPAPGVYFALNEVLANPSSSIHDAAAVVARDVGLTAKILQVVNSAFFGLMRKVTTVNEAAALLGTATLRSLALSLRAFPSPAGVSEQKLKSLQRHSLLTASIARIVVPDKRSKDAAFIAGMLHDIGCLVPTRAGGVVGSADDAFPETSHARLGAYLLGIWGLPHAVLEAVAHHDAPMAVEHTGFDTLDAVYIASTIATELAPALWAERGEKPIDLEYLAGRGITPEQVESWRIEARAILNSLPDLG
jgi:HD-like signal output (HDOD) protein/CheY-like chemotaxis protein